MVREFHLVVAIWALSLLLIYGYGQTFSSPNVEKTEAYAQLN